MNFTKTDPTGKPQQPAIDMNQTPLSDNARKVDPRMSRDQAAPRWTPLSDLKGFNAPRGDLAFLNAQGMETGIRDGIVCIKTANIVRALDLIATR